MAVDVQRDKQLNIAMNDNRKTDRNTEPHQLSTENTRDAHTDLFCGTCDHTFESTEANDGHEPCKAENCYVPRRIGEQVHLTSRPMTSKYTEYGAQPPQKEPYDMDDRNVRAEVRATADAEKAICSAILLGKVDATGSYNVNGHVASIEELQEQLGNLRDRR